HRLRRGHKTNIIVVGLVIVHAIKNEVVLLLTGAIHVWTASAKSILSGLEPEQVRSNHARRGNQRQLISIVSGERQIDCSNCVNQVAEQGSVCLKKGRSRGDFNSFRSLPNLQ